MTLPLTIARTICICYVFIEAAEYMKVKTKKESDVHLRFDSDSESLFYIRERRDSVLRELKYSRKLGEVIQDEYNLYRKGFQAFTEGIEHVFKYTEKISHRIENNENGFVGNLEEFEQLEQLFSELASLLHNLLLSLIQRREKRFRFTRFSHVEYPRFPLYEVHIPYPITIRSLEALCNEFRIKLEGYYGSVGGCSTSIVILQGGDDTTCNISWIGRDVDNENLGGLVQNIRHCLNLIYFTMPRYTASQIRYASLLAHEEIHRLLYLLEACEAKARKIRAMDEGTEKEAEYREYGEVFNGRVRELSKIKIGLVDRLISFFVDQGWPQSEKAGDPPRADNDEYRKKVAFNHISEFCADIGAVLLCGPAYVAANFISTPEVARQMMRYTVCRPKDFISDCDLLPSHPPSILRLYVQIGILRIMGFDTIADTLDRDYKKYLKASDGVRGVDEYIGFLESMLKDGFLSFLDRMSETLKENGRTSYDNRHTDMDENTRLEEWGRIYGLINDGDIYVNTMKDYLPSELLNSIWLRRINEETMKDAPQRLTWRMAIEETLSNPFFPQAADDSRKETG
jgi:hypothetical protein